MIAIKYKQGLGFQWPEKIKRDVSTLPDDYDELLEVSVYNTLISDNQAAYDQLKLEAEEDASKAADRDKFIRLRDFWQKKADDLAIENISKGITAAGKSKEVADAFKDVVYYLNANTPSEAIAALGLITPIPTFLEQSTIDSLTAELNNFITDLWSS